MAAFKTVLLLIISNVFMTIAWYGHLGGAHTPTNPVLAYIADLHKKPWLLAVFVSWGIAFVEYFFQVPANRIGAEAMSRAQLKIVQEVIALGVFAVLAVAYWRESLGWNYLGAGLCLVGAVFFVFFVGGPGAAPLDAPMNPLPVGEAENR